MTENPKDQTTQRSQSGQQKQGGRNNPDTAKRNGNRASTLEDETEERNEQPREEREHDDRDHQHDYKNPLGESQQDRQGSGPTRNQSGNQATTNQNKNQSSNQDKNQNGKRGL